MRTSAKHCFTEKQNPYFEMSMRSNFAICIERGPGNRLRVFMSPCAVKCLLAAVLFTWMQDSRMLNFLDSFLGK